MKAKSSLMPYREWVKEVNRLANEKGVMCLLGDFKGFWKGGRSPKEFLSLWTYMIYRCDGPT